MTSATRSRVIHWLVSAAGLLFIAYIATATIAILLGAWPS